jgi:hypothetical protein
MKNFSLIWVILFWASMLYSCKEISFQEPQPVGVQSLKQVPEELRGRYIILNKTTGKKNDTLVIESWGYHLKDKDDKDWLGKDTLSDSLVVKFYQDYYFINFRSGDQWVLRLIKKKPTGIEFLSLDIRDDAKRKSILKKLSKKFTLKEIKKGDDTFFQINPTATQLIQLIKEGYFTGEELMKTK